MKKAEQKPVEADRVLDPVWKKWGPYLSERQWGTVREDYSEDGNAWAYFSHDQARSRAYHWGEDGLAGISDDRQLLCFALALWNGKDPIVKERLFGLTNAEGNHGEDVKEYYFYLDSTPTHSYMKYLYKYPQAAYPYDKIVAASKQRGRGDYEYELLDTGVFDEDRYFDVFVEYAKATPEDILIQITVHNRGPEEASLRVLPTVWFRNIWSWGGNVAHPVLQQVSADGSLAVLSASQADLGPTSSPAGSMPNTRSIISSLPSRAAASTPRLSRFSGRTSAPRSTRPTSAASSSTAKQRPMRSRVSRRGRTSGTWPSAARTPTF